MHPVLVTVRIRPERRERFLELIGDDATASVRDEPGCLRFEVLRDRDDPDTYYFLEVYADEEALAAHRRTPHYARWRDGSPEVLAGEVDVRRTEPAFPLALG